MTRFEDLIAWQKARGLAKMIYEVTRRDHFVRDYGLSGQIQRAAVSVMSNIAEGFDRGKLTEFHHFLSMAKGSCAEVRSQIYVAFDAGYLTDSEFTELLAHADEVARLVAGLRRSIERRRPEQRFGK